jgi:hypothetical protein
MCGIVRCAFICGLAVFAGATFLRMTPVSVLNVGRCGRTTDTSAAHASTPLCTTWTSWYNNQATSTCPGHDAHGPIAFRWGFRAAREPRSRLDAQRPQHSHRVFRDAWIVPRARVAPPASAFPETRAQRRAARSAGERAQAKRPIIDRLHGIMDRIETRVERLESVLLP